MSVTQWEVQSVLGNRVIPFLDAENAQCYLEEGGDLLMIADDLLVTKEIAGQLAWHLNTWVATGRLGGNIVEAKEVM